MSFADTIATRLLVVQSRRANTKRGARYQRVEFDGFKVVKTTEVYATRTTKNCIWFEDGGHIARDSGKATARGTERVVSYIPVQDES